jgi:hypothetical protein
MSYKSTEDAANAILKIVKDEAQRQSIKPKVEKSEKAGISYGMRLSLKKDGQTFRIRLKWVRDEHVAGSLLGHGYVEKDWNLALKPENPDAIPVAPPFVWKLHPQNETSQKASYPPIMTEDWLRSQIRKKLATWQ